MLDTAVPRFALKALYDRGVRHVLLEGGPTLAGAFVEARCVDEVVAYLAPKLLGAGPAALGDAGIATIADARHTGGRVGHPARRGREDRRAGPVWADRHGRGGAAVFTGIIEEVGEVVGRRARAATRARADASRAHGRRRRPARTARRSRSTALPHRRRLAADGDRARRSSTST